MQGRNARQLIYIPILHTQYDMGSLAAATKQAFVAKLGEKVWRQHMQAIAEMWKGIAERLLRLKLVYARTYLYQDGLPVCGKEQEIVGALAAQGSPNHCLLKRLTDAGAHLVGTEDPPLLVKEYRYLQRVLSATDGQRQKLAQGYEKAAPEFLKARDQFIARRIGATLPPHCTGVMLMGLLHRVDELVPPDIKVSYLIYRLPFQRSFELELAG